MWQAITVKKIQKIFSAVFSRDASPVSDGPVGCHLASLESASPLLLSSPHSGRHYSDDFLAMASLPKHELERMEDRFTDLLLQDAPSYGVSLVQAYFPRSFCDVNRDWRELDGAMFIPPLPSYPLIRSSKVDAGYGVIPRCSAPGKTIYRSCLPHTEAERRLSTCWKPYQQALQKSQKTLTSRFGFCVLLDVHSMPPLPQKRRCDIVLGDLHGRACSPILTDFLEESFTQRGYHVQRNTPYAGGYITDRYGQPEQNQHALQIEINRACYLNLNTLKPHKKFKHVHRDINEILSQTASWLSHDGRHLLGSI